jgi:hypothetical protein
VGHHRYALLWFDFVVETHETGAQLLSSSIPNEKSMLLFQQFFDCCVQASGDFERVERLFEVRTPSQKG